VFNKDSAFCCNKVLSGVGVGVSFSSFPSSAGVLPSPGAASSAIVCNFFYKWGSENIFVSNITDDLL